jgi:1-acyl-sn-glycerol-3-phosphate acyltransferase
MDFPDPIASVDRYSTPDPRRRSYARFLPVQVAFYIGVLHTVFWSSTRAKKGVYGDDEWAYSSRMIWNSLERVGCAGEFEGMQHVRDVEGPAVYVGNHMSTTETFVLPMIIQPYHTATFVIKPSLMDYPVFKHVMRSRNPIVVSRDNPRQDLVTVMEEGKKRLEAGTSVILFPQTTRTRTFDPESFNSLGVKLASRAGVPVVPVALKTDAWENGRLLKDFGPVRPERTVHIAFGKAISVDGNGRDAHERVVRFIGEHLARWQSA